jgi:hypothetical protein
MQHTTGELTAPSRVSVASILTAPSRVSVASILDPHTVWLASCLDLLPPLSALGSYLNMLYLYTLYLYQLSCFCRSSTPTMGSMERINAIARRCTAR